MGSDERPLQAQSGLEQSTSLVIADEILRERIRAIVNEKPQASRLEKITQNPLVSVVVAFLLTGVVGVLLTDYYSGRQQELAARRSFSDELNKIRIQKVGEVWERIDEDELAIDGLAEGILAEPSKDPDSKQEKYNEIVKLVHTDLVMLNKNRFWLGEDTYDRTRGYLDRSIQYILNQFLSGQGTDLSKLKRERRDAKQDILEIRCEFLEGETIPETTPKSTCMRADVAK